MEVPPPAEGAIGRILFGLGSIGFGAAAWADRHSLLALLVGSVQLLGGIAVLFPRTALKPLRIAAGALVAAYLVLAVQAVPAILRSPRIFNSWGNFGEQLAQLAGAALILALTADLMSQLPGDATSRAGVHGREAKPRFQAVSGSDPGQEWRFHNRAWIARGARAAYWTYAGCVVTFMLEQWVYFAPTVVLVPRWLPPGRVFWAAATTAAFGAGAVGMALPRTALLAARLLALMLAGFALLVWVPACFAHPGAVANWTEFAETLTIAGAACEAGAVLVARVRPAEAAPLSA